MKEQSAFTKLTKIGTRNLRIPIFFLCNPNVLGSWQMHKWFPDYRPDPKKEKIAISKLDNEALVYSMPWLGGSRGTIDHLEDECEKQITKKGIFQAEEYDYLTDKNPKNIFVISSLIEEN